MNSESNLTSTQLCFLICRIMSDELNLLDYEYDDDQSEELLNQSASLEEEPMEQEVIVLEEEQPEDPGQGLACGGRDVFEEDTLTNSQLLAAVNAPTQEDPGVPARSAEVEAALQPIHIQCWVMESEQDSTLEPSMEGQEEGLEDPSLSLSSVEPPLGQGSSRQEFKQWSHQSEPSDKKVQEYVWEAQLRASHQDTLDCISGRSSKPQEVSNRRLGFVGECMLRDWY